MLTSEALLERWNRVNEIAGGYSRIDSVHPLELYIGYEAMGQRSLLLICSKEPTGVPSSKSVQVQVGRRHDTKWACIFQLVRPEQEEVFMQLCCDLIESSRHQDRGDKAVEYLLDRYRRWHKLMERQGDGLLSEETRKGLLGELLFLQGGLSNGADPLTVVAGWMGPEQADRDFVYPDKWYEIKTVGAAAAKVSISSLEQLDTSAPGELVVYYLDRTGPGDSGAISLNDKVAELKLALRSSPSALALFDAKLTLGFDYVPIREYNTPVYRLSGIGKYSVTGNFPRLARSTVPVSISFATYDLSLAALEEWRIE